MTAATVTTGRWELLRALGAVADAPAAARAAGPALGLEPVSEAGHTDVFVLNLPPYASVYLGPDGALGGEGADRAAGFWRAIRIDPPAEPDHLSALLSLYASLGEASVDARRPATVAALARSQASLFWEHLWPWLPGYLDAVTDLTVPALAGWARLTQYVIAAEFRVQQGCPRLPLALRQAPAHPQPGAGIDDLTAVLTTPVRSGVILTRHRLALGAGRAGVGHRIGERRFTLRAMFEQDPAATLGWLGTEAGRWQRLHAARGAGDEASRWWASRAARTRLLLRDYGEAAAAVAPGPMP
jgi:Nitrate reductase delta subunit